MMTEAIKFLLKTLSDEYMPIPNAIVVTHYAMNIDIDPNKQEPWILAASHFPGIEPHMFINGRRIQ